MKRTALYDLHVELGGKMVPFAGYELPVQYSAGIMKEHHHTRTAGCASLFDVSHMGQLRWYGKDAASFLHRVVVGDISSLGVGEATLSLLTTSEGGIVDDTVITRYEGFISMVVNGATTEKDLAHLDQMLREHGQGMDVSMEFLGPSQQLLAVQGDGAAQAVAQVAPGVDVAALSFMRGVQTTVGGVDGIVTRCGYTGEDGFEISVPFDAAEALARQLLAMPEIEPAGLGARDSLRLEAGLCLYGNDIDETTTPIEAALAWTIPKSRRQDALFPGADKILTQLKEKSWTRRRVGIVTEKAPARAGAVVLDLQGNKIGDVTSGTMSPTLKQPVAMGYVDKGFHKTGTSVQVQIRNKTYPATIEKMPFVPAKYYKAP